MHGGTKPSIEESGIVQGTEACLVNCPRNRFITVHNSAQRGPEKLPKSIRAKESYQISITTID